MCVKRDYKTIISNIFFVIIVFYSQSAHAQSCYGKEATRVCNYTIFRTVTDCSSKFFGEVRGYNCKVSVTADTITRYQGSDDVDCPPGCAPVSPLPACNRAKGGFDIGNDLRMETETSAKTEAGCQEEAAKICASVATEDYTVKDSRNCWPNSSVRDQSGGF